MTVEDSYRHFVKMLTPMYEAREASHIADWVFESVAGLSRVGRLLKKQEPLNNPELDQALDELLTNKPVQYVLGEAWFCKMRFKVNEHVLIPRPETEGMCELVNVRMCEFGESGRSNQILDVGTGSGCIAVSIKKNLHTSAVTAIDVSSQALEIAKFNAKELGADVEFLQLDFLNEMCWEKLGKFDIIVSNPPYIPENEKEKLALNVTAFEPHVALFVGNNDPFIFYRKIAEFSKDHLRVNGKIYVEVHEDFAKEVAGIFSQYHYNADIRKDIYGRERFVTSYH